MSWYKSKKFWAMVGVVITTVVTAAFGTIDWVLAIKLIAAEVGTYIVAQGAADA